MEKQEVEIYFCPFARERCRGGFPGPQDVLCQFWNIDASRCSLGEAIGGLRELGAISSALQTLASK